MTIIKALILGIIQGLTEFLPISSSGHLMIVENLLGLSNDLIFSLILHLATLLAVVMFYWKDIIYIIKNPRSTMAKSLLFAFIPTVIIAIIVRKFIIESQIINIIGILFLTTSLILFLPYLIKKRLSLGLQTKSGIIIGIMQGVACIPGISRSGTTIVTGQMCGLKKEESVKFSFLLSIPIIIGGILYELLFTTKVAINVVFGIPMIIGFIAAFFVGICSIKIVSRLATTDKFYLFGIYTAILGIFLIINSFVGII